MNRCPNHGLFNREELCSMSTNANRLAAVREYGAIFRAEPIQRSMLGLALFTAFLAASPVYAQVRYEVVSPFSYATNGAAPYAPLVQARDGNFSGPSRTQAAAASILMAD
jgi:hypothetical protein